MSFKTLLLTGLIAAATAPAMASSGTSFINNEVGQMTHWTPSTVTRAQVIAELERAQRRSGAQYAEVGEDSSYPASEAYAGSKRPMSHRGPDMPGVQGMMPDHPHR